MKYNYPLPDIIDSSIELLDGEIFLPITDDIVPYVYPYYMVSNMGRVYHKYIKRIMKLGLETSGYLFITLSTNLGPKIVQMNRLVLLRFNPIANPDLYDANHIDGDKFNNKLSNLEWLTRSENIIHAYQNGLMHPKTLISESQAIEVVNLLKTNNYQCKEIAQILGINENIVNSIKKKESWKHLTNGLEFDSRPWRMFYDNDVRSLCMYFQNNRKPDNISIRNYVFNALAYCGFDNPEHYVDTARKIYTRKHYTNISCDYIF